MSHLLVNCASLHGSTAQALRNPELLGQVPRMSINTSDPIVRLPWFPSMAQGYGVSNSSGAAAKIANPPCGCPGGWSWCPVGC